MVIVSYPTTLAFKMLALRQGKGDTMTEKVPTFLQVAFKWWSTALDRLLDMEDSLEKWRVLINTDDDSSVHRFNNMLLKCGIWGCLVGGMIAVKIARYGCTKI